MLLALNEECLLLECKAAATLSRDDGRQIINMLKAYPIELGLLSHSDPTPRVFRFISTNTTNAHRADQRGISVIRVLTERSPEKIATGVITLSASVQESSMITKSPTRFREDP